MKAVLCKTFGSPETLVIEDIPEPEPDPGEVVLQVRAAALNFLDTLMIRNRYQYKPPMPFSPGVEVAGQVIRIGQGVEGFSEGDRVLAYVGWNGCREQTVVEAAKLIPIPDDVSDETAAGVTVTYGTAMHGLKDRGRLKSGETLAVLGASGGAGLAAVEIGSLMDARVIAVASSEEKLALCLAHGAKEGIDYRKDDLKEKLKELTNDNGVDVIYDCVGGPHAEAALRATAWEGRFLVIGFAAGEIPKIPLNLLLLKGCEMVGVFWGAFTERYPERHRENIEQVLQWCATGALKPHIHGTYSLEDTSEALTLLDTRQAKGKIVICP